MSSEKTEFPVKFTPKVLSLPEFSNLVFCIPIYQRLFAWRKKQIEKLMDDLFEAFKTETDAPYYLGILTVAFRDNRLDLVDGQQRMTITTLMAIAFKKLSSSNNYWDDYLNNGNRLIFSARDEDTAYITSRANGNTTTHINEKMEEGIAVIKSWCNDKFKNNGCLEKFVFYVWNNLTLFCSYLPEKYTKNPTELNRYFESMNSTGRQLQQHEILLVELINGNPKSEIYSRIWTKISDINRRYIDVIEERGAYRNEYLNLINNVGTQFEGGSLSENSFETIEQINPQKIETNSSFSGNTRRQMIISFGELLLMALRLTISEYNANDIGNARNYSPELLLTHFDEAQLKESDKIEEFFLNLLKCRLILDYKIIWQETEGNYDYELLTPDSNKRLEKFQSMLHVSNSDQFYRWLPNYVKWLMNNPYSSESDEMAELLKIDLELHPVLPDLQDLCYSKIDRYWFWRLDYELWLHSVEENCWLKDYPEEYIETVKRYVFRVNRSIEHLHPQTPTDEHSEKWIGNDLDRFGNLAMISSSFNSSQSNHSAGVKMERVHHQIETSQLQSLKMLHMWIIYRKSIENSAPETWTKEKVAIHENLMLSYLNRIRPSQTLE